MPCSAQEALLSAPLFPAVSSNVAIRRQFSSYIATFLNTAGFMLSQNACFDYLKTTYVFPATLVHLILAGRS